MGLTIIGSSGGSGSGTPAGPAGGDLSGSFPNPDIATGVIVDADVAAGAAIAPTKVALVNDGPFATAGQRSGTALLRNRRRVNRWYAPAGALRNNSTLAVVGGLMYMFEVHAERPLSIDAFSVFFTAGASAGQIRFGIWADDGQGEPTGAPLKDSGLVTAPTTSTVSSPTFTALSITTPGVYWGGLLVCNNVTGSPTVTPYSPFSPALGSPTVGWNCMYVSGLTTTLPTLTPGSSFTYVGSEFWPAVSHRVSAYT